MAKKCGIALASMIIIIGCAFGFLGYRSSSRPDDAAWVKSASELRINGYDRILAGDDLKVVLGQFEADGFSDALLLVGSKGTIKIDGREHEFAILDEKSVGGAQILLVNRGFRKVSLVGARNSKSLEDLLSASGVRENEQDAAPRNDQ